MKVLHMASHTSPYNPCKDSISDRSGCHRILLCNSTFALHFWEAHLYQLHISFRLSSSPERNQSGPFCAPATLAVKKDPIM